MREVPFWLGLREDPDDEEVSIPPSNRALGDSSVDAS